MATTKKDGGANMKYWDSPDVTDSLENVRNWLTKNCKKVKFINIMEFFHRLDTSS